jgi:hypothetical protein
MNDKKCKHLNTRQNSLIINKKKCKCQVINNTQEINYDLKNLIKELIIHKYFK